MIIINIYQQYVYCKLSQNPLIKNTCWTSSMGSLMKTRSWPERYFWRNVSRELYVMLQSMEPLFQQNWIAALKQKYFSMSPHSKINKKNILLIYSFKKSDLSQKWQVHNSNCFIFIRFKIARLPVKKRKLESFDWFINNKFLFFLTSSSQCIKVLFYNFWFEGDHSNKQSKFKSGHQNQFKLITRWG